MNPSALTQLLEIKEAIIEESDNTDSSSGGSSSKGLDLSAEDINKEYSSSESSANSDEPNEVEETKDKPDEGLVAPMRKPTAEIIKSSTINLRDRKKSLS